MKIQNTIRHIYDLVRQSSKMRVLSIRLDRFFKVSLLNKENKLFRYPFFNYQQIVKKYPS